MLEEGPELAIVQLAEAVLGELRLQLPRLLLAAVERRRAAGQ